MGLDTEPVGDKGRGWRSQTGVGCSRRRWPSPDCCLLWARCEETRLFCPRTCPVVSQPLFFGALLPILPVSSQCCFDMFCRFLLAQLNESLPKPCPLSRTQWAAQDYLCTSPTVSSSEDEEFVSPCPCGPHTYGSARCFFGVVSGRFIKLRRILNRKCLLPNFA